MPMNKLATSMAKVCCDLRYWLISANFTVLLFVVVIHKIFR